MPLAEINLNLADASPDRINQSGQIQGIAGKMAPRLQEMEQMADAWGFAPVLSPPGPLGGGDSGDEDIEQRISRSIIQKPNDLLQQPLNVTQDEYDEGRHVSFLNF